MTINPSTPGNIDDYIAGFPATVQENLQTIRLIIRQVAPEAAETIKYQIPTFTLKGNLISFAAYKNHIGMYPRPGGSDAAFQAAMSAYEGAKSSLRFPLDKPVPFGLIEEIVKVRLQEHLANAEARRK
jgi:uncharacterized protein YdhG (YjbR/CyaY superfamily)